LGLRRLRKAMTKAYDDHKGLTLVARQDGTGRFKDLEVLGEVKDD
jgi:hypothetical protein